MKIPNSANRNPLKVKSTRLQFPNKWKPTPFNVVHVCDVFFHSGLTVYLYRAGDDRLQYKGTKSTEGLSKFLIKNLGDAIVPNLLEVPEKLDALNELDSETFADHVATGNHLVISETDYLLFGTKLLT